MIQILADGRLAYDSRVAEYELIDLKITRGVNIGGTAEITMPKGHPAYSKYISYKTIVEAYRDGKLRFRGRALYPADDFYGKRTVTCEGELCFLQDTINRPYQYNASPQECFESLITAHNASTDPEKAFKVGQVTVEAPDGIVQLENERAEKTGETLNKLLAEYGGYIVFTSDDSGARVIHWLASLDRKNSQTIELGENLLDYSSTGANTTELATGIIPYGAKDEETGKPVTIESVNGGKDFIVDTAAAAVHGTIMTAVTWNEITDPAKLLEQAWAYLETSKQFITSLTLSAVDLSYLNTDMDALNEGDLVRVVSKPHGIDEYFQITRMTERPLNPSDGEITMGKEMFSLTSYDASAERRNGAAIESASRSLKKDYQVSIQGAAEEISKKASEEFVTKEALSEELTRINEADQAIIERLEALEQKISTMEETS